LRLIINELDDHAIEEAIVIKERSDASVTVIAPDFEGVDDVLFTAAAKGADRLIKLTGDFEEQVNNHALARAFTSIIKELNPDLILSGVQAHDDLDGSVGPLVAGYMGLPYVGYVSRISLDNEEITIHKEYPGGVIAVMKVKLPAVLGIQAAEQPPRYVAISKVRQAMKTATIEEQPIEALDTTGGVPVNRMFQPETTERATMIEGDENQISNRLIEIFREAGVL
jgi:electron transfer flavoprotein beta subunit